jgi:hypothetical protein
MGGKTMIDPIDFLNNLKWDNAIQTWYVQKLKTIFTGDDVALKLRTWEEMCFHCGIVTSILQYTNASKEEIPEC